MNKLNTDGNEEYNPATDKDRYVRAMYPTGEIAKYLIRIDGDNPALAVQGIKKGRLLTCYNTPNGMLTLQLNKQKTTLLPFIEISCVEHTVIKLLGSVPHAEDF